MCGLNTISHFITISSRGSLAHWPPLLSNENFLLSSSIIYQESTQKCGGIVGYTCSISNVGFGPSSHAITPWSNLEFLSINILVKHNFWVNGTDCHHSVGMFVQAHFIKDRRCNTARAVFALSSLYKWALSGTPLQNRVGELYSLVCLYIFVAFFLFFYFLFFGIQWFSTLADCCFLYLGSFHPNWSIFILPVQRLQL